MRPDLPGLARKLHHPPPPSARPGDHHAQAILQIDPTAVRQIHALRQTRNTPTLKLRIIVRGGGCSGFQYRFELTEKTTSDDHVWQAGDVQVVVDPASQPLINGATLEYFSTPLESGFRLQNPLAKTGCGCGASFSLT